MVSRVCSLVLCALVLLMTGCSPASYDLAVRVVDERGGSVLHAKVALAKVGEARDVDGSGEVTWTGIAQDSATIVITGEGYVSKTVEISLVRGHNEVDVTLERPLDGWGFYCP